MDSARLGWEKKGAFGRSAGRRHSAFSLWLSTGRPWGAKHNGLARPVAGRRPAGQTGASCLLLAAGCALPLEPPSSRVALESCCNPILLSSSGVVVAGGAPVPLAHFARVGRPAACCQWPPPPPLLLPQRNHDEMGREAWPFEGRPDG